MLGLTFKNLVVKNLKSCLKPDILEVKEKMSEQIQTVQTQPQPANIQYILYDPAKRRRRVGRRKYDPQIIAYEPARRRRTRRKYDPVRVGGKAITDSIVDGLGFGLIAHTVPIPSGNVGSFSYSDIAAGVLTLAYEKWYMRRGWTAAILGAVAGVATGKLVQTLGGWKS